MKPTIHPYVFAGFAGVPTMAGLTADGIVIAVCKLAGVTTDELFSPSRKHNITKVRQACAYWIYHYCRCTYEVIGQALQKDRATARFALLKALALRGNETEYAAWLYALDPYPSPKISSPQNPNPPKQP